MAEEARLTVTGRAALAGSLVSLNPAHSVSVATYFKIGTSGFHIVDDKKVPMVPSTSLTDIRSVADGAFWYRKALVTADLSLEGSSGKIRARLETTEGNGDTNAEPDTAVGAAGPKNSATLGGAAPEFFEVGIFDAQDRMLVYGTFSAETKTPLKVLSHLISVNY